MLTELSDYPTMVQAGPEICVCSTKVFTAHLAWGYLLAKAVAGQLTDGIKEPAYPLNSPSNLGYTLG
jgi:glucosamine 6-phosphate synthetase-like amidotransferase/phosphosugar isomerase protein